MKFRTLAHGPLKMADELIESVQYRGRKASRSGSEQRRVEILEATLRIIVRDGMRGVRHRAVAAEAGVPLSATTYYFEDIHELIDDSFGLFVKRSTAHLAKMWQLVEEDFRKIAESVDRDKSSLGEMVDRVVELVTARIQSNVREQSQELLLEPVFRQIAVSNDEMRPLYQAFMNLRLHMADVAVRSLGSSAPLEDAKLLTTLVCQMEYLGVVDGLSHYDIEANRAVLRRFLVLVSGL